MEHARADLLAAQPGDRCPACSAALRPGAPWCTLCYADLRPAEPEPVALPEPAAPQEHLLQPEGRPGAHAADPSGLLDPEGHPSSASAPVPGPPGRHAAPGSAGAAPPGHVEARWPCSSCGDENPMSASACATCGAGFLAGLRDEEPPLLELPGVGDISRLSRAQRIGLALSFVLVVVLLTTLVSVLAD